MVVLLLLLNLLMQRGPANPQAAAITGQLQTKDGAPASAVYVSAIPAPPPNVRAAEGIQYYEAPPPVSTTISDAQGRYRLGNVPPGRYYVVAATAGQGTYFPGTADRNAAAIVTVERGSNTAADIRLVIALGGRVSGRITPPPAAGENETAVLSGLKLEGVLETPIRPDGSFEFGHLPHDTYLLNVAPTPPGLGSLAFKLADDDYTGRFNRPPTHRVSGRVVAERGPVPVALLAFSTAQTYEPAAIKPDGTFSVRLNEAHHMVELGGMPVGYGIASVRVGATDTKGSVDVRTADVTEVVVTVSAPRVLPHVRGKVLVSPLPAALKARLTGPIVGALEVPVQKDGTFDFQAVTPGHYTLVVPGVPQVAPTSVVVDWNDANVEVRGAAR